MKYNKVFRIFGHNEDINDGLRPGMKESDFIRELDGEMSYSDIEEKSISFFNNSIYIRDDGRKAKRLFDLSNKYFYAEMVEVTDDIVSDNDFFKEEVNEFNLDENKYSKEKFEKIDELSKEFVNDFRLDETTIDDVLDKIVDNGMEYIDDIDKEVLKNKKPS